MRALVCLALVLPLMAGCLEADPQPDVAGPITAAVTGFVHDGAFRPIPGAVVSVAGSSLNATVGTDGRFRLDVEPTEDLVLTARASGYVPSSRSLPADFTGHAVLDFTLYPVSVETPFHEVLSYKGFVRCAVSLVVGEDQDEPHEHPGAACGETVSGAAEDEAVWVYRIPDDATAVILEAFWEPNTELSQVLVMKVLVRETRQIIGFLEGASPLHFQVAQAHVQRLQEHGVAELEIVMLPGAGTGTHEHGAVGVFLNQDFELFGTAFFNQPAPPTYTVAG